MSNPNNGKVIEGTEDFTGGEMYLPSGSSNGKDQSILYNNILKRLAEHDHSGKNSVKATLPQSASQVFPDADYLIVVDAEQPDMFQITLRLATITPSKSNVAFYYRGNAETEISDWKRFYPEYTVNSTEATRELTITGLMRSDIEIKVSA